MPIEDRYPELKRDERKNSRAVLVAGFLLCLAFLCGYMLNDWKKDMCLEVIKIDRLNQSNCEKLSKMLAKIKEIEAKELPKK